MSLKTVDSKPRFVRILYDSPIHLVAPPNYLAVKDYSSLPGISLADVSEFFTIQALAILIEYGVELSN